MAVMKKLTGEAIFIAIVIGIAIGFVRNVSITIATTHFVDKRLDTQYST